METLCNYDYDIEYTPGKSNYVADAQSRRPDLLLANIQRIPGNYTHDSSTTQMARLSAISTVTTPLLDDIRQAQANDPAIQQTATAIKTRENVHEDYRSAKGYLEVHDGMVTHKRRPLIPPSMRYQVFHEYHAAATAGHHGVERTTTSLLSAFFWPRMAKDIRKWVKECDTCQRAKPTNGPSYGLAQSHDIPTLPWQQVSMDLITDLPVSNGCDSVLVVVDYATKWVEALPCRKGIDARGTAKLFLNIISQHGLPTSITSDRDPRFTATFWRELFQHLGTKLQFSTAYHPQSDRQTERANRSLEQILRTQCGYSQDDWTDWLPLTTLAHNSAINEATGVSPFQANYGFLPRLPQNIGLQWQSPAVEDMAKCLDNIWQFTHDNQTKEQARIRAAANKH